MKQRNTKFANAVREGKKATHESQAEKRLHKSPLSALALGVIVFVVVGGGACLQIFVFSMELIRKSWQ